MGLREPDCPTSGSFSHTSPLSPPLKHPSLQRAEDVDALLLGMASQIAEREDHVVVEDVRGEAEAVPASYAALAPGKKLVEMSAKVTDKSRLYEEFHQPETLPPQPPALVFLSENPRPGRKHR